ASWIWQYTTEIDEEIYFRVCIEGNRMTTLYPSTKTIATHLNGKHKLFKKESGLKQELQ
ncbi:MAG: hypothetical protein MHPSP_004534, partial [Paramarteilia canceri]